ncbi:MAG: group II intron maturase-specific domain-containing protein, partial [Acidimicrobiales bacterium]
MLANILLDDWDKELERRGHRFVRYADDCNIYVRSERAAQRVFETTRRFLERRLKLRVNVTKSRVGRPETLKFLGFTFYPGRTGYRIQVAPQSEQRLKATVRRLTRQGRGAIELVIFELNRYLRGWLGYFRLSDLVGTFKELDGWIHHRLRAYQWRQWPRLRT